MQKFSQLLAGHNSDSVIRKKILKLTSGSSGGGPLGGGGKKVGDIKGLVDEHSVESVIDIHSYMLAKLKETMATVQV